MSDAGLSHRLSTLDASFLYGEKPHQAMHVGSIAVYDGELTRDEVIAILASRLHLLPRYRQKVVFPPFGIAHPTWEDDPNFDIAKHVDEAVIPAPGDDRAMATLAAELYAPPLDRTRPLWQVFVLNGRADGNTALLWKVHHAMVDGVSGVELTMVMHDLTRDAEPPAPPASPWQPRPIPDALTLMQNAVRDVLTEQAVTWTDEQFLAFRPAKAAERQQLITSAMTSAAPYALQPAPRTPFNGQVSAKREYAWAEIPFAEVRGIRSALGGTVNDVVLAVVSGALRRYLQAKGYPVNGVELRAMCPVSMRPPEQQQALGNLVSSMIAPLYVGIADPVERLRAEREAMDRLKQQGQAAGFYAMTELSRTVPAWVQAFAAQGEVQNTLINTVSTNVPGPQIPLYLGGREMLHMYGMGILSAGVGLFIAIGTYNRALAFGLLVDPQLVPDPWVVAGCFQEAFAELRAAAERVAPPVAPAPAPAKPRRSQAEAVASR